MQKLPEVSDRKKGRRMRKEKGTSRQKEEAHSLSANDRRIDNISIFPLLVKANVAV